MPEADEALRVSADDGVLVLELNRPGRRNALNLQLKEELAAAIRHAAEEPSVRAVLLRGAGGIFCAGGDLGEMDPSRTPAATRRRFARLLTTVPIALARLEKPVIAAVDGGAYGAGFSLALSADIVLAADDASFAMSFAKVGLIPDTGMLHLLPRRVGLGVAKELIFTSATLTATEARDLGLVNRVCPARDLEPESMALARRLASGPALAFGLTKALLDRSATSSFEELAEAEALAMAVVMSSDDHAEGVAAFFAKRRPVFTGG